MSSERDIEIETVLEQERILQFPTLDAQFWWALGAGIRNELVSRNVSAAVEVSRGPDTVFFFANDGAAPDLTHWLRRKRNTVLRFRHSTRLVALQALQGGYDFYQRFRLTTDEFLAGAGGFPINVERVGLVGVVALSGLTGNEDHEFLVRHLQALQTLR